MNDETSPYINGYFSKVGRRSFIADELPEALRKLADWVEENDPLEIDITLGTNEMEDWVVNIFYYLFDKSE